MGFENSFQSMAACSASANLPVTISPTSSLARFSHGASAQGRLSHACPASAKAFKSRHFKLASLAAAFANGGHTLLFANIRQPASPVRTRPIFETAHQARAEYCSASSRTSRRACSPPFLYGTGKRSFDFRRWTKLPAGKNRKRVFRRSIPCRLVPFLR